MTTTDTLAALARQILRKPGDAALRWVLADWLEELGRGEDATALRGEGYWALWSRGLRWSPQQGRVVAVTDGTPPLRECPSCGTAVVWNRPTPDVWDCYCCGAYRPDAFGPGR